MAELFYDKVWVREPRLLVPGAVPVGNVALNEKGKSIFDIYFTSASLKPVDLTGKHAFTSPVAPSLLVGQGNRGYYCNGNWITFTDLDTYNTKTSGQNWFAFAHYRGVAAAAAYQCIVNINRMGAGYVWMGADPSGNPYSSPGSFLPASNIIGATSCIVIHNDGASFKSYVNGKQVGSTSATAITSVNNSWVWGNNSPTVAQESFNGIIFSGGIGHDIPSSLAREMSVDPYQFLIPA